MLIIKMISLSFSFVLVASGVSYDIYTDDEDFRNTVDNNEGSGDVSSGNINECLIKKNHSWICNYSMDYTIEKELDLNPEDCREKCVDHSECSVYGSRLLDTGKYSCDMCSHGVIEKSARVSGETGVCPKTRDNPAPDAKNTGDTQFWCQIEDGSSLCRFPFLYKGHKYYEPVKKPDGTLWCGVEDKPIILEYTDDENDTLSHLVQTKQCKGSSYKLTID